MKPIKQTIFGDGKEDRPHGNCLSACVAFLLEISIETVPVFVEKEDWFGELYKFITERGFKCHGSLYGTDILTYDTGIDGYYIVNGKSPRAGLKGLSSGMKHSVIFYKGKLFFDPHPDNKGLASIESALMIEPKKEQNNNIKVGDKVKILEDIKDAYEETWHEKGDILEVKYIAKDGEGLMFSSDLGIHYSKVTKIDPKKMPYPQCPECGGKTEMLPYCKTCDEIWSL
jgi:hypothetical protein